VISGIEIIDFATFDEKRLFPLGVICFVVIFVELNYIIVEVALVAAAA